MRVARIHANLLLILPVSLVLVSIACRAGDQTRQPGGFVVAPRVAGLEADELTATVLPSPAEPPTATPTPSDSPTAGPLPTPTAAFGSLIGLGGYPLITTEQVGSLPPGTRVRISSATFDGQAWLYQIVAMDEQTMADAREHQLAYAPDFTPGPTPTFQQALIHYFSVVPEDKRLAPGETFTVFWKLEAVETVSLCAHDHAGWQKFCLDDLPAEGTHEFEMPPDVTWLEMRLIAPGLPDPGYLSAFAHATCANQWFMDSPPFACPDSGIAWLDAIAQRFERGWMIYAAGVNDVDIFLDDGAYLDLWLPNGFNNVVDLSAEIPPEGLYRPDPQLSAIWLGHVPGAEDLRERLGWAAGPAFSVQTIEQCEFAPPGLTTQPCYQPVAGAIYQFTYEPVQIGDGYMRVGQWVQYDPAP